ncbi:conjugal transfer protein TraF, partial [Escherichia coli]
ENEKKPVPAVPRQEPDIMQKLAALQTATKRALYEAILYPGVDNFVKYFRLQNYWTQQAGLFTMSARKAMLAHPELDYNLQYSHYNGTVRNQLAADQAQQRQAIAKLAEHYGIMFFYRGQDPIDGQLAQQYGFSVFPYTLDGQGDTAFPEALPVPPDVMQTFFPNIPVATPTTFLVNVNTLEALPLLQGATDAAGFMARMDTVLQMYGGKKGAK